MSMSKCFSCGGNFPDIDGPVHKYMASSTGCWATYGEVLAREYSNPTFFEVHRLTVDAYAVQHPGSTDRQSIQSVGVHLIRLCLFLEHDLLPENANELMLLAGKNKKSFHYLEPPKDFGLITAKDVFNAKNELEHKELVRNWSSSVWDSWSIHHETIREWLPHK